MKVYVAGSSADLSRARRAAEVLVRHGIEVPSTWWEQIEKYGEGNPTDLDVRITCAGQDCAQVDAADVLWLLVPETGYSHGAFFEFGRALTLEKRVVCSGATKRSIFCSLAIECATDGQALEWILQQGDAP